MDGCIELFYVYVGVWICFGLAEVSVIYLL